jgi:hypothetical protein
MIITPRSDFSLEDIRTCGSHGKSTDRFIPSRKSSTIRTKMDFVEGSHRQNPKNIVLSKFKCKILGLSENDKSLRYSSAEENPNSTIPEFISDKYYESVQSKHRSKFLMHRHWKMTFILVCWTGHTAICFVWALLQWCMFGHLTHAKSLNCVKCTARLLRWHVPITQIRWQWRPTQASSSFMT